MTIQRWVRGYLAKLQAKRLRVDRLLERQKQAAVQLQAAMRATVSRQALSGTSRVVALTQ